MPSTAPVTAPGPSAPPVGGAPGPAPAAGPAPTSRRHLRRSPIATGVVALGLLAGIIGLAADSAPHLALGTALLAIVAFDAVIARRSVGAPVVRLHGPVTAVAGLPSHWTLQAVGLRRPVVVLPAHAPREPQVLVEDDRPGTVTLPPLARGVLHHLVVDVVARGPIGLYQAGRRVVVPLDPPLAVAPAPLAVPWDAPRPRAVAFGLSENAPLGDDLFRSIRPYTRGDEPRRVHWGSTARHGRLMVREDDGTGVIALQLVVDTGPPGPTAEWVLGVAAGLAVEALHRGWLVELVTVQPAGVDQPAPPEPGSPFGYPHVPDPWTPTAVATTSVRVATPRAVERVLASAVPAPPTAPAWRGQACIVDPGGVRWR